MRALVVYAVDSMEYSLEYACNLKSETVTERERPQNALKLKTRKRLLQHLSRQLLKDAAWRREASFADPRLLVQANSESWRRAWSFFATANVRREHLRCENVCRHNVVRVQLSAGGVDAGG